MLHSFYSFKLHAGLFYRHARRYTHTVWRNGRRVEETAVEHTKVKCRRETLDLFRELGIMDELESGRVESARIVYIRKSNTYVCSYNMASGRRRKTLYYVDNKQSNNRRKQTL